MTLARHVCKACDRGRQNSSRSFDSCRSPSRPLTRSMKFIFPIVTSLGRPVRNTITPRGGFRSPEFTFVIILLSPPSPTSTPQGGGEPLVIARGPYGGHCGTQGTRTELLSAFRNVKEDTSGNERFNETWTYKGPSPPPPNHYEGGGTRPRRT